MADESIFNIANKHEHDVHVREACKALEPYKGKRVMLHLYLAGEQVIRNQPAIYAGRADEENRWAWACFLTSKEESLDGTISFNGYYAHLSAILAAGRGEFSLYFPRREEPRWIPFGDDKKRLEELAKMWENREMSG